MLPKPFKTRHKLVLTAALGILGAGAVVACFLLAEGLTGESLLSWFEGHEWRHGRVVPLNLLAELNNDGIAGEQDPGDANFDHPEFPVHEAGSCFPAEELPPTGSVFGIPGGADMKFLWPSSKKGAFNNIVCAGQQIGLPWGRYRELALVAASHGEPVDGDLELCYEDRARQERIRVPGWLSDTAGGLSPCLTSTYHFRREGASVPVERRESNARVWLCRVPLDDSRELRSLLLPYDRRMHVFAVSLEPARAEDYLRQHSDYVLRAYRRLEKARPPDRWGLARKVCRIRKAFDGAKIAIERTWPREIACLEITVEYLEHLLRESFESSGSFQERLLEATARQVGEDLAAFESSGNPYPGKRGNFLCAYRSAIDGALQPYSLSVPQDYKPAGKYALIILLHGHGWYQPFQGHPTLTGPGVFYAAPHGRGSMDYMFVAEEDILDMIRDIVRTYPIDTNKVMLAGSSMGGTGCWNCGVKFPYLFAAVAPSCGNTNHRVWEELWSSGDVSPPGRLESLPPPFRSLCTSVSDALDPITYAGNMVNLPSFCLHGAMDEVVPVEQSRTMVERLREFGCPVTYREDPEAGHGGLRQQLYDEQWNWLFNQRRNPAPCKIRHRAWKLKYGRSYWLTIRQFLEPLKFAELETDAGDSELVIRTQNVGSLSIDWATSPFAKARAEEVSLRIDGSSVVHQMGSDFTVGADGRWSQSSPRVGLAKRAYLEGPVQDVYTTPFMLVYGTPADDAEAAFVLEAEARRFARDWQNLYGKPCRIKADFELTEQDIADYSLVLYGNSGQNDVHREIAARLPVRIDSRQVSVGERQWEGPEFGVKFCYPNPLNTRRYVAVLAGTTWRGCYGINNRFGNWLHWGPNDNCTWFDYGVFDARTNSPATMVLVGFFDQQWGLSDRYQFEGHAELRESALERVVPKHFSVPGTGRLFLSDLMPARLDQHKGNVNSDRSFRGNRLRIGRREFEKGLGVRAPSTIEFATGRKYRLFNAMVGIDLEGGRGTEVRLKNESIQFQVWGDERRLYRSPVMQWGIRPENPSGGLPADAGFRVSDPVQIQVSIEGVETLCLKVVGSSARWHFGSAAWGDAWVE